MNDVVIYVLTLLTASSILGIVFLYNQYRKHCRMLKLKELVSWSVIGDYDPLFRRYSFDSELINALKMVQQNVLDEYRVDFSKDDESKYCKEIVHEYQQHISRLYFRNACETPKNICSLNGIDYFMLVLYHYLLDHQCDSKFINYDIHKETLTLKSLGAHGGPLYNSRYSLSDFSIVYHKMLYISYMYCLKSEVLSVPSFQEKFLKEILDTQSIELGRF